MKAVSDLANTYSEEARQAARELRRRIQRDLNEGRFTSRKETPDHSVPHPGGANGQRTDSEKAAK